MAKRNTVAAGVKPVGAYTLAWATNKGTAVPQAQKRTVGHVGVPQANGSVLSPCGAHNGAATATRTNAIYVPFKAWPRGMDVCDICVGWVTANTATIRLAVALAAAGEPQEQEERVA